MNRIARVAPTNATETGTIPMSQADEALRRVIADRLVRPVLEEHERVKDPLPTRPPRPHPQGSTRTTLDFARPSTAAAIGPRRPGVVYYDGPRLVQVAGVITDESESQRVLKRRAAKFAIRLVDQHAGTAYYTGAVWTGSDRVLKAVA
ncbi:hypothetical protein [Streptomyces bluensis]|uniref:Uncharacterized protein n=1 Tax=Streptomyces bluensis TaxID=33897 RepID=A0ABW6UV13_9ACTN